jgi:FHS family glucose/mannose:H+ symporter-like MFS transporter
VTEQPIRRGAILLALNACMFIFGVVLLLMGALLPELHVSGNRAGGLGSFPLLGILAATIVIGPILDKAGAKPVLAVALAMVTAALATMASLTSYSALAAAALVYGFGGGILNTATNALVSVLSASGRGAALNLLGCSFSLGGIAAPLLMSLASGRWPASTVLHVLAVAPALALLLILALRFPRAAQAGTPIRTLARALSHPIVWLIGALLFFESGDENCMFVWAGKVSADMFHLAGGKASLMLVALSVALGVGRLLAAFSLKKIGSRPLLLLASGLIFAGAIVVRAAAAFGGVMAGFVLIGLGLSPVFPTALGVAGDRFPDETGTVFGAIMTTALVGGTAGPTIGGWAAGYGPRAVLIVPLVASIAIAVLALIATRTTSTQR